MTIGQRLIVLGACVAVVGCAPLSPRPDHSKFFILTPLAGPSPASPSFGSSLSIGLGPIDFPGYLRSTHVVTRTAPGQLAFSPEDRWAEPLDRNFKRVLAENLTLLLKNSQIVQYPWNLSTRLDYKITVEVLNCEAIADDRSELSSRWVIRAGSGDRYLYASETKANAPISGGDTGISIALSSDVAILSRAIASAVEELERDRRLRESSAVCVNCN